MQGVGVYLMQTKTDENRSLYGGCNHKREPFFRAKGVNCGVNDTLQCLKSLILQGFLLPMSAIDKTTAHIFIDFMPHNDYNKCVAIIIPKWR